MNLFADLLRLLEPYPPRIVWHIALLTLFLASAVIMASLILFSRLAKKIKEQNKKVLITTIAMHVNAILINDQTEETVTIKSSFKYNMDKLFLACNKIWKKQLLLDHLIEIKKSIGGSSANVIDKIHEGLNLQSISLGKLNSFLWRVRAKGIKELATFNCKNQIKHISKFLWVRNKVLRNEAYFAVIQLSSHDPLVFLDRFAGKITPWMELNFHYHLSRNIESKKIDFSRWYNSKNIEVALFAIRMTIRFRQISHVDKLSKLLSSNQAEIKWAAVKALGQLEAYQYADEVAGMHQQCWHNNTYSKIWLKAMSNLADHIHHKQQIIFFLSHDDLLVRLEATRALVAIGGSMQDIPPSINRFTIEPLFAHVNNPLLKL
ncbi:MAG TPA: hypothetical protein PKC24_01890 [Cyclobacteriaceae bacterium]|nr:hypothetical protein [Cyclobacteriaceae bacterium]